MPGGCTLARTRDIRTGGPQHRVSCAHSAEGAARSSQVLVRPSMHVAWSAAPLTCFWRIRPRARLESAASWSCAPAPLSEVKAAATLLDLRGPQAPPAERPAGLAEGASVRRAQASPGVACRAAPYSTIRSCRWAGTCIAAERAARLPARTGQRPPVGVVASLQRYGQIARRGGAARDALPPGVASAPAAGSATPRPPRAPRTRREVPRRSDEPALPPPSHATLCRRTL
eukprot:scaffold142569_cov31-Tisochrysis_lutea.AAC.3